MSEKMTIVFNTRSGHILGAVTRRGNPTSILGADQVAAPDLSVRGGPGQPLAFKDDVEFKIPFDSLKTSSINLDTAVLTNPSKYGVDKPDDDAPTVQLLPLTLTIVGLSASKTGLSVTLSAAPPAPGVAPVAHFVWGQVEPPNLDPPIIFTGSLKPGDTADILFGKPLPVGDGYLVLVMAQKAPMVVGSFDIKAS